MSWEGYKVLSCHPTQINLTFILESLVPLFSSQVLTQEQKGIIRNELDKNLVAINVLQSIFNTTNVFKWMVQEGKSFLSILYLLVSPKQETILNFHYQRHILKQYVSNVF